MGSEPLNYESLVTHYEQNLKTQMRGFRTAVDYLDIWVPDTDHVKSLLNLVESAQISGHDDVTILLSPEILKQIDLVRLEQLVASMGKVDTRKNGAGTYFHVSGLMGGQENTKTSSKSAADSSSNTHRSLYRLELGKIAASEPVRFEQAVQARPEHAMLKATSNGVTLSMVVNPRSNQIVEVGHQGAVSPENKALYDRFCEILKGLTMQEASDHSVVRLEFMLRDKNAPRPVKGIVIPENADSMFATPKTLVRDLMKQYREQTGNKSTVNWYDPNPSQEWAAMNDQARAEKIQAATTEWLKERKLPTSMIQVRHVFKETRALLGFADEVSSEQKPSYLRQLERFLKDHVEEKIEVFAEEWKDKNEKRRL